MPLCSSSAGVLFSGFSSKKRFSLVVDSLHRCPAFHPSPQPALNGGSNTQAAKRHAAQTKQNDSMVNQQMRKLLRFAFTPVCSSQLLLCVSFYFSISSSSLEHSFARVVSPMESDGRRKLRTMHCMKCQLFSTHSEIHSHPLWMEAPTLITSFSDDAAFFAD